MCDEEAIVFEDGSISQDTYELGEEFTVTLKVRRSFLFVGGKLLNFSLD